jgi:long-chain acyl-CoA synthetase
MRSEQITSPTRNLSPDPSQNVTVGVHCGARSMSHAEVKEGAGRIASGLAALGVGAGDRVAIVLRNDIAFPQISLATGRLGAFPVPVNWHWKADEIRYVLEDSGSKVVFAHQDLCELVERVLPAGVPLVEVPTTTGPPSVSGRETLVDWTRNNPVWDGPPSVPTTSMIYRSGTTGRPKGVLREHASAEQAAERSRVVLEAMGLRPGMRTMVLAPLYHTAPNIHLMFAVQAGYDVTIIPRFDPEETLRVVQERRIDHIQAVPTHFVRLLQLPEEVRSRYDLSSLQAVVHAAAACPEQVKRAMIEWLGPIVLEYYGGTETGIVVALDTEEWLAHPRSVGRPVADAELIVLGPDGQRHRPGEVGEIYIKPPSCQPPFRYHGLAESQEMYRDGYVTIGDVGYLDRDGFLYITDRASDMVISGGVNIYPVEIEHCILSLPGVKDVAVFGIPDPEFGESLVAHVQLLPGAALSEADVTDHVRGSLAGYKVPKRVVFDPNLPRDESGKLVKRRLRDEYNEERG